MSDILNKIEFILEKYSTQEVETFFKEDVLKIINIIKEEVKEDSVLLEIINTMVENSWNTNNKKLMESITKLFSYYGILNKKGAEKKMVMEKKGSFFIKREVELENLDSINRILNK